MKNLAKFVRYSDISVVTRQLWNVIVMQVEFKSFLQLSEHECNDRHYNADGSGIS